MRFGSSPTVQTIVPLTFAPGVQTYPLDFEWFCVRTYRSMASSGLTGDDDGAPIFDSLAKFYASIAIVWTVVIFSGAGLLIANRREQCIRIRNLPLVLSAVGCLHVYWILCLVAYSMNGRYPCVAEYWVMSIYLPLGIALFQANSMQLLSVFLVSRRNCF